MILEIIPKMGYKMFMAILQFTCISAFFFASVSATKKRPHQYHCSGTWEKVPYCIYEQSGDNTNIIINVPESGRLLPTDIPVRDAGCLQKNLKCVYDHHCGKQDFENCKAITNRVRGADEIGRLLAVHINKLTNVRPHYVKNNLHRSRMDGNREIFEASFKSPSAADAFHDYHDFIRMAASSMKGRRGLFIDLHGHKHDSDMIEIGYLLNTRDLNQTKVNGDYSTIKGLIDESEYSFEQILRGNKSLGHYFSLAGFKAVPSPQHPVPEDDDNYLTGGYNLRLHAAIWNHMMDGIQIALPVRIRTDESKWSDFAKVFAKVIVKWMQEHY